MAPLDMGTIMNLRLVDPLADQMGGAGPDPREFETIGGFLKAVRLHKGLSISDLAQKTRISTPYLLALEDGDLSALPARPFAIGYVRSYASTLGIDGDAAAARFKMEIPDYAEPLRNPVGVKHEKTRGNPLFFLITALLVGAVVAWNVTQHRATPKDRPAHAPILNSAPELSAPSGPIALGAATPPPADQTMPAPYVTPGLAVEGAANTASGASLIPALGKAATKAAAGKLDAAPPADAPATFIAGKTVYGAAPDAPAVVLQALKPASLIIRGVGGTVYFARQLAAGEAYRAPTGAGLSADIANPDAFAVYAGGHLQGRPAAGLTPVDRLNPPPPPAPKAAAAAQPPQTLQTQPAPSPVAAALLSGPGSKN